MFIQQRQHQEQEGPHCCLWKKEEGEGRRGGGGGSGRERSPLNDSNLGTWAFFYFLDLRKTDRLLI